MAKLNINNLQEEFHPIPNGFLPNDISVAIVGTFPPRQEYVTRGKDFFFYASVRNHLWNRVDNIFPNRRGLKKTKNKNSDESETANKERKQKFASENRLAFIDIYTKVKRKKNSSKDADIIAVESIFETGAFERLISSENLKRICCTYKLAYDEILNHFNKSDFDVKVRSDMRTANGEIITVTKDSRSIDVLLLFPATRSKHKNQLKDDQYRDFLFIKKTATNIGIAQYGLTII